MRISDFVTAAVYLVVGVSVLYMSMQMDVLLPSGHTGPGFFPAALSGALILLAVLLALSTIASRRTEREAAASDQKLLHRPLILWLLLAASVLVFDLIGFITSMVLLMAGLTIGLERRRLIGAVAASLFLPLLMHYVFGTLLGVRLPTFLVSLTPTLHFG